MTRKKVVLFVDRLGSGGADRQVVELARSFAGLGHWVDLVAGEVNTPFEIPAGARLVVLGGRSLPRLTTGLARHLRREQPDLLIASKERGNTVAPLARVLARAPTRVVLRLATHLTLAAANRARFIYRLIPSAARLTYRLADDLVAISAGVARDAERVLGLPEGRVRVIHNPVDVARVRAEATRAVDHPWLQPDSDAPVVIAAGRLSAQKDFSTLLRAFARLRETTDARLLILGEGKDRIQLEAEVKALGLAGSVQLPGYTTDLAAHMARGRLFVLSSRWEGFGNVITEALAVGASVVATDCESGPREILAGGRYGMLVPVGDDAALAEAMRISLATPVDRSRLQERAAVFTPERAVAAYCAVGFGGHAPTPERGTAAASPTILFVINDAPFFLSHRLPAAEAARDAGLDVHVATPPSSSSDRIRQLGFTFHAVRLSRSGTHPLREAVSALQLLRLYRQVRPDIVHHATIKPVLYGGFAARLVRVPASVSTITGLGHLFTGRARSTRVMGGIARFLYRGALAHPRSRIIFQNPDDLRAFVEGGLVRAGQAVLIRGSGVDLNQFRVVAEPGGDPLVILPSRMLWSKGVPEFVEAAGMLQREGVAARFALVGSTDPSNPAAIPEDRLREWDASGVVEWWGFRDDMPEVLASSHVVCMPSAYGEGVPKALIEAAACGRPIVTTDAPGCREIVLDGENGFLVPVGDARAVARAIRRLVDDPGLRGRMGRRGRELAEDGFGVEAVSRRTVDVYRELIGRPVSPAPAPAARYPGPARPAAR
jgi:glycosyltransferase involved in cell wall biosynthesis